MEKQHISFQEESVQQKKKFVLPRVAIPNNTILTSILGVLLLLNLGVGLALIMSFTKKSEPVVVEPTPTPTPDPTKDWQPYTSNIYGFDAKVPDGWRIQEGVNSRDTSLYFHSDEAFGNIRYYVTVSSFDNPQKLSIAQRLLEEYGMEIQLSKEKVGKNIAYLSRQAPAQLGAMSAYIPREDESSYLTVSLTPFNSQSPYREQGRYERIFVNLLSTITLSGSSSAVISPTPDPDGGVETPSFWRTYNDRAYPYSFDYPPEVILDTSRTGRVLLDKQIEFVVTSVNPDDCEGFCPVREKTSSVRVGVDEVSAKKHEGYLTSQGGRTPQRYLQYVIRQSRQYYMVTLYELPMDTNEPTNRTPKPIEAQDVQLFEQILATLRFTR